MIDLIAGKVEAFNRGRVPLPHETIEDDMDLNELLKIFSSFKYYFRDKESCPFNRGNWVIDFFVIPNSVLPEFSIKLPACMKKKEVERWLKPLSEKIKMTN